MRRNIAMIDSHLCTSWPLRTSSINSARTYDRAMSIPASQVRRFCVVEATKDCRSKLLPHPVIILQPLQSRSHKIFCFSISMDQANRRYTTRYFKPLQYMLCIFLRLDIGVGQADARSTGTGVKSMLDSRYGLLYLRIRMGEADAPCVGMPLYAPKDMTQKP
jgi:hypothetical protein